MEKGDVIVRILITTDWYEPTINGVVRSVLNLRKELLRKGHEVRVLTLSQSTLSFRENDVFFLGSIPAGAVYPGARLRLLPNESIVRELISWRPEIVHSQCEFSTFRFARRIASAVGAPLIHTYHTVYENYTHYFSPSEKWGRTVAAAFSRHIASAADCVIAPTEKTAELLRGYRVDCPIRVIPTGIDLSLFYSEMIPQKRRELRRSLDIPDDHRILLYVGRLAQEKNVEELIRYVAHVSFFPVTLLLVGDGPYRGELEALAAKRDVADRVKFAGAVPPRQVAAYYQIGDLFVSASTSETQGLTYIEALASGLPLLCREDPCLDEILIDGQNGWRYSDEQGFRFALTEFLRDADGRRAMQTVARSLSQGYSMETFAGRVFGIYQQQMQRNKAMETVGTI